MNGEEMFVLLQMVQDTRVYLFIKTNNIEQRKLHLDGLDRGRKIDSAQGN